MSLQIIGFRVVRRGEYKPGRTQKQEILSRTFTSQQAATDFCELARKQYPDSDIFVESVQRQEGRRV